VNDDDTSTTTSFELVIIFVHHFSEPLCIVISLFLLLTLESSAALKKNNARSLTMRVRIFPLQCYGVVAVLRVGYAEVIFIQPDGKLDTMWRDAWQRLASCYPTSRWDVAVNLMVTAAERCSLSHRQKHRNLQRENLQFTLCTKEPGFEHGCMPSGV